MTTRWLMNMNCRFQSGLAPSFFSCSFETSITGIDIFLVVASDTSECASGVSSSVAVTWCSDSSCESCSGDGVSDRSGGSGDVGRRVGLLATTLSSELAELPLKGLPMRTVSREYGTGDVGSESSMLTLLRSDTDRELREWLRE